jgi:hypothetical protein
MLANRLLRSSFCRLRLDKMSKPLLLLPPALPPPPPPPAQTTLSAVKLRSVTLTLMLATLGENVTFAGVR